MSDIAERILAAEDLPSEEVPTPEWAPFGVPTVRVRGLTAKERDSYERSMLVQLEDGRLIRDPNLSNIRAKFVTRIVVDDAGKRVFSDSQVKALGEKNAAAIDRLWDVGRRLSGMDSEENPSKGEQDGSPSPSSPSPSDSDQT